MKLRGGIVVGLVLSALLLAVAPAAAQSREARVDRVLILSLPNTTWADLEHAVLPNLHGLLAGSGVADTSIAGVRAKGTLGDSYVMVSAGARAQSRKGDGACAQPEPGAAIVCSDIGRIADHNDGLLFDAQVGLLGETLERAGVSRSVVTPRGAGHQAALAFADRDGVVPDGVLGAPSLADAFADEWAQHDVVLVELPAPDGLRAFDDELGEILAQVDPARDAVLVIGPSEPEGKPELTVAALQRPGLEPGFLRSAYTRRSGVVGMVDVAPTVLDQLGIERPAKMEGRPFVRGRTGGDYEDRVDWLVDTNIRSRFRDRAITIINGSFVGCHFVLAGLVTLMFLLRRRVSRPVVVAFEITALALLYFLPATYLGVLIPFPHWGMGAFWLFLVTFSLAAGALTFAITKRTGVAPLIIALSAVVGLIVVDQLTGGHLQFNGTFGYSPTIGGRYAGLGNLGYAQLAAGAVLLAGLVAHQLGGGRAGLRAAAAILVLALIVDGTPYFGADVGGVLSMVPAFGVMLLMLSGRKLRWRVLLALLAAGVVMLAIAAAIDLSRDPDSRSHLGRLLAGDGSDIGITIRRKIDANLRVIRATAYTWILPVVYAAIAYVIYKAPGPIRQARNKIGELDAALAGVGLVALLGTLLNDSGVAITGVMLGVLVPVLTVLCLRSDPHTALIERTRDIAEVEAHP